MRQVPFSRSLLIERSDFDEFANKKYFRFKGVGSKAPPPPPPPLPRLASTSPASTPCSREERLGTRARCGQVRLRFGYVLQLDQIVRGEDGEAVELRCSHVPGTAMGGKMPDGEKVKGIIHWVSEPHAARATVRLYDRLFTAPEPGAGHEESLRDLFPPSPSDLLGTGSRCCPVGRRLSARPQPSLARRAARVRPRARRGGVRRGRAGAVRADGLFRRRPRLDPGRARLQPRRDVA